jgi:tRNA-dihydrouridine synthase B
MTRKFPKLSSPAILSPMAGVTDVAFRTLCRRFGAGMTYSEFVSSAALVRNSAATERMLATDPSERPVAVQLFGASVEEIVAAAQLVEQRFDVIDLNCGCPAWKVIKTGAGSAMLNEPTKIARLVEKVSAAVRKPITVKIRSGVDERHINAVEVARAAEAAGAAAVAVHGRTQRQGYAGKADWNVVKEVKDALSVPVIGNGDVFTAQDFLEKKKFSGCDFVMVARGAIGNPGIFREINELLRTGISNKTDENGMNNTDAGMNNTMFFEYYKLAKKYGIPFAQVKTHAVSFTKGLRGGARLRERLAKAKSEEELHRIFVPENF